MQMSDESSAVELAAELTRGMAGESEYPNQRG